MNNDQPKAPEGVTGAENTSCSTQGEVLGLEITLISVLFLITRKKKYFHFRERNSFSIAKFNAVTEFKLTE